jgi:hypothetical protein
MVCYTINYFLEILWLENGKTGAGIQAIRPQSALNMNPDSRL